MCHPSPERTVRVQREESMTRWSGGEGAKLRPCNRGWSIGRLVGESDTGSHGPRGRAGGGAR